MGAIQPVSRDETGASNSACCELFVAAMEAALLPTAARHIPVARALGCGCLFRNRVLLKYGGYNLLHFLF